MANVATENQSGIYLYGITAVNALNEIDGDGVGGAAVEAVVECGLAAFVSRVEQRKVRPQRANLAAHQRVLRKLAERRTVLPIVFGMTADGEDELRGILRRNRDALIALLGRLEGKVEMGLKVYWEPSNILEYFVATHHELETMRDRLFRAGRTPTLEEKIELGKLFEALLKQSRERHTRRVIDALTPYCADLRTVDVAEERMVMKLACLIEKHQQPLWEEGVQEVASLFDNHYRFDYNGPWPPHNFVDFDLKLT